MTLFTSTLARLAHKPTPVRAHNISLDTWCNQTHTQHLRFVHKIELCTALSAGEDGWGMPLGKHHHHTLLRVTLSRGPADTLLIERVLSTGGAYHAVAPIPASEPLSTGGTLLHPDVHDRACVFDDVPSGSTAPPRDLAVERTLTLGERALSLAQFAQILGFVGRATKMVCDGGDCTFQSRSFAFTCLAALGPTLPPRRAPERVGATVGRGPVKVDDSVFELSAEAFLGQVPWLVKDAASLQALQLIGVLKDASPERTTRLYH